MEVYSDESWLAFGQYDKDSELFINDDSKYEIDPTGVGFHPPQQLHHLKPTSNLYYYAGYLMYIIYNLIIGPVTILADYYPLIQTVVIVRLTHLIIDQCVNDRKQLLKDLATSAFGIYQINNYLTRLESNSDTNCRPFINAVLAVFVLFTHFKRNSKPFISFGYFLAFAPILINEYLVHVEKQRLNTSLRAILMGLSMKFISQIQNSSSQSFMSLLTYFFHPASCMLGLWHPHHIEDVEPCPNLYRKAKSALKISGLTFGILMISANLSDIAYRLDSMIDSNPLKAWLDVYFTAQEFRFSHYFVCYLGFGLLSFMDHGYTVCKLSHVEWPRSLVQVVIYWNLPMHHWLRTYIFKPVRANYGVSTAILTTYVVSSTLHGFKFHIWAVLLTLGFLTWIEHKLRSRLAERLNACVLTEECRYNRDKKCLRSHTRTVYNSICVHLINLAFRVSALAHLAYLGYIFLGNTDDSSYKEALDRWSNLYFYTHVIGAALYSCITIANFRPVPGVVNVLNK